MSDTQLITARSLLLGFLELRQLSPDLSNWTEERFSANPPRLFRLRQLVAMFGAFGLPWDPPSFTKGKFIEPEHPRYAPHLAKIAEEMPLLVRGWSCDDQLPDLFEILFDYRTHVDHVLSFSCGVLEASGLYLYAHRKAEEMNRIIRDNVSIVDDILVALISPEETSFSVEQLTREYGYPDVDLFEIDSAWE